MRFTPCLLAGIQVMGAAQTSAPMDEIADAYVQLVLAVGRHDASFVDAYYGPKAWKIHAEQGAPIPIPTLLKRTSDLQERLAAIPASERRTFLQKQLTAVAGFLRRLAGEKMSLAVEARLLYDIEIPTVELATLEKARKRLEVILPGKEPLETRIAALRARFTIPPDRLPKVAEAALAELRKRTAAILPLPTGEAFRLAFVKDKPWGGYNWYEGNFHSLIQVNTDLPMALDKVTSLLAHEGYPGHHLFNILLEERLVKAKGWREFTVYPLYSPQSLIAEGTANAALGMVMSDEAHRAFMRDVLAPIAGLDTKELDRYLYAQQALDVLSGAGAIAIRMQLEEQRPEAEVEAFLCRYQLVTPERARKSLAFNRANRAYVFTYSVGQELVERHCGQRPDRVRRYLELFARPVTPSTLASP